MGVGNDLRGPVSQGEVRKSHRRNAGELLLQGPGEDLPAIEEVVGVEGLLAAAGAGPARRGRGHQRVVPEETADDREEVRGGKERPDPLLLPDNVRVQELVALPRMLLEAAAEAGALLPVEVDAALVRILQNFGLDAVLDDRIANGLDLVHVGRHLLLRQRLPRVVLEDGLLELKREGLLLLGGLLLGARRRQGGAPSGMMG